MNGNHVEHWVNGAKVVEYQLGSSDLLNRVRASRLADVSGFCDPGVVALQLQTHAGNVWFRNIRIRLLTAVRSAEEPGPASAAPKTHALTNRDGKTIKAEFLRLEGPIVFIRKDGKEFPIPLAKLSTASAVLARELSVSAP